MFFKSKNNEILTNGVTIYFVTKKINVNNKEEWQIRMVSAVNIEQRPMNEYLDCTKGILLYNHSSKEDVMNTLTKMAKNLRAINL